jgi:flagellar motor switch protein FliN/FliY
VCVSFRFKVGSLIDSTLSQWIPLAFARELAQLARTAGSSDDSTAAQRPRQTAGVETSAGIRGEGVPSSERVVQRPEFVEFPSQKRVNPTPANLSLLYDVPLQVTVELGRTKRSIKEILELTTGSILELDKLAGEPVDIYVNQKRVALGEVVVIDENFGVRVTDIISPAERMRNLQ